MENYPIFVVIPTVNGMKYLPNLFKDLWRQQALFQRGMLVDLAVWIISNGSSDGTREFVRQQQALGRPVQMTCHERGHSVAESWNYALRHLFDKLQHEKVVVLNDDVRVRADFISALIGTDLPFATGVGVSEEVQLWEPWARKDTPHPDFSGYCIRRDCWDTVGEFDERFKGAYCEDSDYHVRAHRAKVELTSIGIPFLHFASGTLKVAQGEARREIELQADANRRLFFETYGCFPGDEGYQKLFSREGVSDGDREAVGGGGSEEAVCSLEASGAD